MRIFIFLILICFNSFTVWANVQQPVVSANKAPKELLKEGKRLRSNGNLTGAIRYFCLALLLDPDNSKFQENLLELSKEKSLHSAQMIGLLQFEGLLHYQSNLKRKIEYYKRKKDSLLMELEKKGADLDLLMNNQVKIKPNEPNQVVDSRFLENDHPLEAVNSFFANKRELLSKELETIQYDYNYLKAVKYGRGHEFAALAQKSDQADKKVDMASIHKDLQMKTKSQNRIAIDQLKERMAYNQVYRADEIIRLREQLFVLKGQLNDLKLAYEEKDKKTSQLTNQVVNLTLQLSEKEMLLQDQSSSFDMMNDQMNELRSRIALGQRIMQEKDEKITTLEDKLNSPELSFDNEVGRFKELMAKLNVNKGLINEQEKRINELNDKLNVMKDRALKYHDMLQAKDDQIIELNGILQIYREKLSDAVKQVKRDGSDISGLKNEITFTKSQLVEKDKSLKKTERKLTLLEDELSHLYQQLHDLNVKRTSGELDDVEIRHEFLKLEPKLEGIHKYIAQQLTDTEYNFPHYAIYDFQRDNE